MANNKDIGPLKDSQGNIIFSDKERANLLNTYFSGVCTNDNNIIPVLNSRNTNLLCDVSITSLSVFNALTKMKNGVAAGPDFLPAFLYKNLKHSIAYPLTLIFQSFFSVGTLPTIWRSAFVRPIFKKGVVSDPSNYRPISLTCVGCKVFERVIKDVLVYHLVTNNLITEQQHGFLAKHSTCTNLLEALNEWTLSLDVSTSVAVAYIDFSRAFDSVCHSKLLAKLESFGISGNFASDHKIISF